MISVIILSGPWPESDNIILKELVHIPIKGDEFIFNLSSFKKQAERIKVVTGITGQVCRVGSVSHHVYFNMQEIKIHLCCGEMIEK
jgi:hypothetical protein